MIPFGYIRTMEQNESLDQNAQLQMAVEELNANRPIDTIGCKQFAWGAMHGNWLSGAFILLVSILLGWALQIPLAFLNEDSGIYWAWTLIATLLGWIIGFGFFVNFLEFCSRSEKFDKVPVCGIFQYGFLFADSWSRILAGDLCLFMVSSFVHSGLSQDLFLYNDGICSAGPSGIFSAAGDYSK